MHNEISNVHINQLTKKYILDLLNLTCFSNKLCWDGDDLYNDFPIFQFQEDDGKKEELRGVVLSSKNTNNAMRMTISVIDSKMTKEVCYRVTNLLSPIVINDERTLKPFDKLSFDVSISDLDFGMDNNSNTFSYNLGGKEKFQISNTKLFSFLRFLLSSDFTVVNDKSIFEELVDDIASYPPLCIHKHYKPIFEAVEHINKSKENEDDE